MPSHISFRDPWTDWTAIAPRRLSGPTRTARHLLSGELTCRVDDDRLRRVAALVDDFDSTDWTMKALTAFSTENGTSALTHERDDRPSPPT